MGRFKTHLEITAAVLTIVAGSCSLAYLFFATRSLAPATPRPGTSAPSASADRDQPTPSTATAESLFNGEDLTGWTAFLLDADGRPTPNDAGWSVTDGNIVCRSGGHGALVSHELVGDFQLDLQLRLPADTALFIAYRNPLVPRPGEKPPIIPIARESLARQLSTDTRLTPAAAEAIWQIARSMRPPGQWNTASVRLERGRIAVTINRDQTLNGPVSRYYHQTERWRRRGTLALLNLNGMARDSAVRQIRLQRLD